SGATLYFAAGGNLYTLNQSTGAASLVAAFSGAFAGSDRLSAMDIQPGTSIMFASKRTGSSNRLVTVNLTTGAVTDVGASALHLDALAFVAAVAATPTATATSTGTAVAATATPIVLPTVAPFTVPVFIPPTPIGSGVLGGVIGAAGRTEQQAPRITP